jgi:vancomycin permeability regulator SanA
MKDRLRKQVWFFGWVLLGWLFLHLVYISWDGLHDDKGKAEVAIILGAPVHKDGTLSPWLKGRVDKAIDLYRHGRVKKIFASGGPGEEPIPEGNAMRTYLLQKDIPDSNIIPDNRGTNTYFTAKDFIQWNDSMHYTSAFIVTSWYHITRSKYIVKKLGFENVQTAASEVYFWKDGIGALREVAAFYKYLLFY